MCHPSTETGHSYKTEALAYAGAFGLSVRLIEKLLSRGAPTAQSAAPLSPPMLIIRDGQMPPPQPPIAIC